MGIQQNRYLADFQLSKHIKYLVNKFPSSFVLAATNRGGGKQSAHTSATLPLSQHAQQQNSTRSHTPNSRGRGWEGVPFSTVVMTLTQIYELKDRNQGGQPIDRSISEHSRTPQERPLLRSTLSKLCTNMQQSDNSNRAPLYALSQFNGFGNSSARTNAKISCNCHTRYNWEILASTALYTKYQPT